MSDGSRWCVPSAASLVWKDWDEASVIFDPRSGDTHLLDAAGREILRGLEQQPMAFAELCRQAAQRLEVPDDSQLQDYVRRLVDQLLELGLVERVPA